jgi:DNA helicase IV
MAKRMILVDERVYDEMWKRTPTETSKSHLINKLQYQLVSTDIPDDVKAKLYQRTLKRFLNLKEKVPDLQPTSLNGLMRETRPRKQVIERRPKVVHWEPSTRQSRRKHTSWSKYNDE